MKIKSLAILTLSLQIMLAGKAMAETISTIQFLDDADNVLASSKLFSAFTANGDDVVKIGDKCVGWRTKDAGSFFIEPKLSTGTIDRIVVSKMYKLKPKYKNHAVVKEMVEQANRKFNLAIYSIEELDNDTYVRVLGYVCFIGNSLDVKLLKEYCLWLNSIDFVGLKTVDDNCWEYFE